MFLAGILGRVSTDHDQRHFNLQGTGANQTSDLRLGADLVRHQIEQADL